MTRYLKLIQKKESKGLADVIVFDDGQIIVKWSGSIGSLVVHKSLEEFKSISLNDDRVLLNTFNLFGDNDNDTERKSHKTECFKCDRFHKRTYCNDCSYNLSGRMFYDPEDYHSDSDSE